MNRRVTEARLLVALNPYGTLAGVAAVVLGGAGVIVGEHISQGMTHTLAHAAPYVAHAWGALTMLGGLGYLCGLFTFRPSVELPSLYLLAVGYGFYAVTVIAGLQLGGFAAGTLAAALCLGSGLKIHTINRRVRGLREEARTGGSATTRGR